MIEREQSPYPNQLKPNRSDSWAIDFGSPRGPLFLHTLCTTPRPGRPKILFHEYAAKLINPDPPPPPAFPHEIRTLAQDPWKRMEVDCWHHREPP